MLKNKVPNKRNAEQEKTDEEMVTINKKKMLRNGIENNLTFLGKIWK